MSKIEKQIEPIASAWMSFDQQRGLSSSVTNSAAFPDFLLRKGQA